MIRKVLGWVLMIGGGIYFALLGAQGLYWLVNRNPVEVHVPTLVVSLIVFSIGVVVRDWGQKSVQKKGNNDLSKE